MSCDVGLTDIQPLSLTCPRGSQEKHVSLNLRPSVFSELRGGREERRMLIVPKAKLTGISLKRLKLHNSGYRLPQGYLSRHFMAEILLAEVTTAEGHFKSISS